MQCLTSILLLHHSALYSKQYIELLERPFLREGKCATFWSKVGEMGVGEMGAGKLGISRLSVSFRTLEIGHYEPCAIKCLTCTFGSLAITCQKHTTETITDLCHMLHHIFIFNSRNCTSWDPNKHFLHFIAGFVCL